MNVVIEYGGMNAVIMNIEKTLRAGNWCMYPCSYLTLSHSMNSMIIKTNRTLNLSEWYGHETRGRAQSLWLLTCNGDHTRSYPPFWKLTRSDHCFEIQLFGTISRPLHAWIDDRLRSPVYGNIHLDADWEGLDRQKPWIAKGGRPDGRRRAGDEQETSRSEGVY